MKYCTNCGAGISDTASFCSNCGSKQEEPVLQQNQQQNQNFYSRPAQPDAGQGQVYQAPPVQQAYTTQQGQPYMQPAYANPVPVQKKSKTPFLVVGIIIAIILCAVVLFPKIGIGGNSYESAFDNFCEAINTKSISKLYKCLPPSSEAALKGMMALGGMDEDMVFQEFSGAIGDNVKVDYRIIDAERLDEYELSMYQDSFSGDTVTDGYNVEIELTIRCDGEVEEETTEMVVVKIGNRWCFADFMF